ncbi:MAG: peptide chain release factor-like protein [Sedimentisphaerales bacterium]|nr:peptide chain release factor-like protein [Sedimentisphaerales bacterium]MBN2842559.1 peptide chain release factor-like protein [Sedimentisphaerales bacterium]
MSSGINFGVSEKKADELRGRMSNCGLSEGDLEESFVKGSGPGGQKVNKTSSCVQLKHIPTGTIIKMQKERSLALNRFFARRKMCELLEIEQGIKTPEQGLADKIRKQKQRRKRRGKSGNTPTALSTGE